MLIVVLAAVTAAVVTLLLFERPADPKRGQRPAGTVGGRADIVLIPASASSAPLIQNKQIYLRIILVWHMIATWE